MSAPQNNIWLHRYAVLTALVTLGLIGMGGLVTSHEAGMAVPDWPTSYGYNMFALPFKFWKGGTFYEHTHRLWASGVGLLTTILVLWLFGKNSRPLMRWAGLTLLVMGLAGEFLFPNRWQDGVFSGATGLVSYGASFFWPRCERAPKWLRWLGVAAFLGVVAQGILGGLRVTLHMDNLGIFHAALAQLFLVLLCAIALFTSKWWMERRTPVRRETQAGVQALACSGGTLKRELQRAGPVPGAPPVIVFSLGTHGNWDDLIATGASVLGIDWRFPLADARRLLPAGIGLQGNLAPTLLSDDTPEKVAAETSRLLEIMRERKGYIFNLGHGVPPDAKLENIAALVETVKHFK